MRREQLHHLLRAAAFNAGSNELIVFGSQTILGWYSEDELPHEAQVSVEADICPVGDTPDGDLADRIDGAMGEDSLFHQTHGYYAQGTPMDFVRLPDGWWPRRRTIKLEGHNGTVEGHCLEPHDVCISKLIAGREKDRRYCSALVNAKLLDVDLLKERLELLPGLTDAERNRAMNMLIGIAAEDG